MILYTSMPHELVFQSTDDSTVTSSIVEIDGVSLVVEPISNQQCRVVQMLSTNPNDFLNGSYQPGTILSMKPQL